MPGIINRIKNIMLSPRSEWPVIAGEPTQVPQLFIGYVAPLAAFAAVMAFVHMSIIGVSLPFGGAFRTPLMSGLLTAVMTLVFACIGVFLIGLIINALAPTFGGRRDLRQALKTAAYSLTPAYASSLLALSPILATLLELLAGCYGIYVLCLGLPVLMSSPKERAVGYTATVVLCTFLLGILFSVASVGLGIAGHASGLMGNSAAEQQAEAQQGTAAVGSVIGGALGTDDKGKAGITAALNNLVKAGEQSQAAAAATNTTAQSGSPATTSSNGAASGAGADAAQNPAAAVGGLMSALGGALGGDHPHAPVDFKTLTGLLPPSLPGMKRVDARGDAQGAVGVTATSATGSYQGDNGAGVKIEITDMAAVSGLMGMASSLVQSTTSESSSGYEKDMTIGGRTVHEKYDAPARHADLSVMLAKRYQVELTGDNVDMGALEHDLGSIDLSHLESMKDAGAPK
jgi:hypothetical protein